MYESGRHREKHKPQGVGGKPHEHDSELVVFRTRIGAWRVGCQRIPLHKAVGAKGWWGPTGAKEMFWRKLTP